jgi:amino acid adenylation domain-containing protein
MEELNRLVESLSVEEQESLMKLLGEQQDGAGGGIAPRPGGTELAPLSFAQERLWFLAELEPDSIAYSVPIVMELHGELDVPALEWALGEIVRRHEVLRTVFVESGGAPRQLVLPAGDFALPVRDLRDAGPAAARELIAEESARPFDLARGPLFRGVLARTGDRERLLVLGVHHIVFDAWSHGVFNRELSAIYTERVTGRAAGLPELPVQYADFALWQRESDATGELMDYWRAQLAGVSPVLQLPADHARPADQTFRGDLVTFDLPADLVDRLRALCRTHNVTMFMTVLAAFQIVLSRYTGRDDFLLGAPSANRGRTELDPMIGFFVNTLVLRADLRADPTVAELLDRVSETSLGAFEHQALPFEQLVEELAPARDLSYTPLVQVLFAFTGDDGTDLALPGLDVRTVRREDASAKFDLTLRVQVGAERSGASVAYNRDLFDRDRIERFGGHLRSVLAGMVARPDAPVSEISIMDEAERRRVVTEWNGFGGQLDAEVCLHHLIEARASEHPDRIAVQLDDERLTYRELDERANEVAWRLADAGVAVDDVVGVCAERSLAMVVGTLGVLKAGAGYLPLAPDHPDDRLRFMVEDAGVRVVVAHPEFEGRIDVDGVRVLPVTEQARAQRMDVPVTPDNLAYVIYTSGSTGRPKGTHVGHHAIANNLLWMQRDWPLDDTDRLLHKTLFTFDVSVKELFWPLLAGARLVLARPGGHRDPAYLRELIVDAGITVTHFVPSMLQAFLAEPGVEECRSLRLVMCGAEALSVRVQDEFFEKLSALLLHLYGPTEAAIAVTAWPCERGVRTERVPLGRPMPNCRIYVLDPTMSPVPAGVPGELHIGGVPLARGYAGRADTTAEKFVPDPFGPDAGGRLYRTGDVARWRPDGLLEFIGRADSQVKIRGLRIEPGEVEAVLGNEPGVAEAVVIARTDGPGPRLVAYLRPREGAEVTDSSTREYLRERVPDYLVPADIVVLDEFPRLPNGKVDRSALPEPVRGGGVALVEPRTPAERALVEIWGQVLKRDVVGVGDNFFDLGGDSLLSIQVVAKARRAGLTLTVRDMFRHQTIAALAATLKAPTVAADEPTVTGPVPLTPAQHEILRAAPAVRVRTLEIARSTSAAQVAEALRLLAAQHDALLLTIARTGNEWQQRIPDGEATIPLAETDASPDEIAADEGQLTHATLCRHDGRAFLVLAVHPLLIDDASWRFLTDDLHTTLDALAAGDPVVLPPRTSSFRRWSLTLADQARSVDLASRAAYWTATTRPVPALPRTSTIRPAEPIEVRLTPADLAGVTDVPAAALTAFLDAVAGWTGATALRVDVHADGRHGLGSEVDVSRTVGRFAMTYPIRVEVDGDSAARTRAVRAALDAVPDGGTSHGVLRHLRRDVTSRTLAAAPAVELGFDATGDIAPGSYPLALSITRDGDGWTATWSCQPDLDPPADLVDTWLGTLRTLGGASTGDGADPFVVLSRPTAAAPAMILVHPVAGHLNGYQTLVRLLGDDVALYGLMAAGLDGDAEPVTSVPEMADHYLDALRRHGVEGPYRLAGWSFGGLVAFEMAGRLAAAGERVALVAAIDSAAPGTAKITGDGLIGMLFAEEVGRTGGDGPIPMSAEDVMDASADDIVALVATALAARHGDEPADWVPEIGNLYRVFRANMLAAAAYRPDRHPGDLLSIVHSRVGADRTTTWPDFVTGDVTRHEITGDHYSIMAEPHVHRLVEILRKHIGA